MNNLEFSNCGLHPRVHATPPDNASAVRASGRFTADEVRMILAKTETRDMRQLGCPDQLFDRILERRAANLGFDIELYRREGIVPASRPATETEVEEMKSQLNAVTKI